MRKNTLDVLKLYNFKDDKGDVIDWKPGQIEIIDCIANRSSPDGLNRVEIIASTRYGKSLATAAGIVCRINTEPEPWAIVAGTKEKARIIMDHILMLAANSPLVLSQLVPTEPIERLRMRRSQDRLSFKRKGEVRVYSAEATLVSEVSKALMGFGSPNVVEDEAALIPDQLQATVMRMLGDQKDNFLVKIGNPFNRNHFMKTWLSEKYYKIFIDYKRAILEGRLTEEFANEMREEAMFDVLYECKFPEEGTIDIKGWLPLLTDSEVRRAFVDEDEPFGESRFGCDVAGGGRNFSVIVQRAYNLARKIYKGSFPDTMMFIGNIFTFANKLGVKDKNIFIDNIGIGRGVLDRAKEVRSQVKGVGGGSSPSDVFRFKNLRAEMYWRAREWILRGGKLERDDDWLQLTKIRYRPNSAGRIQIMSKEEMLRDGIDSPDVADSLAMTFAEHEPPAVLSQEPPRAIGKEVRLDPYDQVSDLGMNQLPSNNDPYE